MQVAVLATLLPAVISRYGLSALSENGLIVYLNLYKGRSPPVQVDGNGTPIPARCGAEFGSTCPSSGRSLDSFFAKQAFPRPRRFGNIHRFATCGELHHWAKTS